MNTVRHNDLVRLKGTPNPLGRVCRLAANHVRIEVGRDRYVTVPYGTLVVVGRA